jgi:hypothetical protein
MTTQCPHCQSHLPDYWWETNLPQHRWTEQQRQSSAQRQRAQLAYQNAMGRAADQEPV